MSSRFAPESSFSRFAENATWNTSLLPFRQVYMWRLSSFNFENKIRGPNIWIFRPDVFPNPISEHCTGYFLNTIWFSIYICLPPLAYLRHPSCLFERFPAFHSKAENSNTINSWFRLRSLYNLYIHFAFFLETSCVTSSQRAMQSIHCSFSASFRCYPVIYKVVTPVRGLCKSMADIHYNSVKMLFLFCPVCNRDGRAW